MWTKMFRSFILSRSTFMRQNYFPVQQSVRNYGEKELKRFYKNVTISQAAGGYEVNLDKLKLKTPMENLFKVPHEALALAVAHEWQSQKETIKRHKMPMTSLCNTAIDNPTGRSRDVVITGILEFLDTDTICYRLTEPPQLAELETQEWDPLLTWLQDRYGVTIKPTTSLAVPEVSEEARRVFRQHLESHNDWALVGYTNIVECLQSLILTVALVDRHLTVEQAVALSRLELEFQIAKWGNVEWHHEVDIMELRQRTAAGTLLLHLNTEQISTKIKSTSIRPVMAT